MAPFLLEQQYIKAPPPPPPPPPSAPPYPPPSAPPYPPSSSFTSVPLSASSSRDGIKMSCGNSFACTETCATCKRAVNCFDPMTHGYCTENGLYFCSSNCHWTAVFGGFRNTRKHRKGAKNARVKRTRRREGEHATEENAELAADQNETHNDRDSQQLKACDQGQAVFTQEPAIFADMLGACMEF